MKNLKRALSLALACVMVLGLMVVGAGAVSFDDFGDKDKVVNVEAVSTLNTLGVILGKDDGNFDPTGIVTRAEMAKMICVILNGGKEPQLGTVASNTYSDTAANWAAPYIEYCTTLGIVGGDGTGKFNPSNTVTGSEAAKMLLVAMGYDADHEKMVGGQWATSVDVLANGKKLYNGLNINPSEGLSRDNAAQMVYNAINAKMVIYTNALVTDPVTGALTSIPRSDDATYTMLNKRFGAIRVEGVVTANEFTNNSTAMKGKTTLGVTNNDEVRIAMKAILGNEVAFTGNTFEVSTGKEMFGRSIILYVKPGTTASANKATVIADAILSTDNVVATTTKGFGTDKDITDFAKDNGMKFDSVRIYDSKGDPAGYASSASYYTNYGTPVGSDGKVASLASGDFGWVDAKNMPNYTNKIGTEIILIDNDADGIVDVALQNIYYSGQVTKYTTKDDGALTIKSNGNDKVLPAPSSDELQYVKAYEDIAKDDYVNFTKVDETWYVTKADVTTGELDNFKKESGKIKNVTVDGTTYDISANAFYAGTKDLTAYTTTSVKDTAIGTDGDFYLDFFGYAVALKLNAASAYAYIGSASFSNAATSFSPGTLQVYAVLEDGTAASYTVSKYYQAGSNESETINSANFNNGGSSNVIDVDTMGGMIYKYSLDGEDNIKLTEIAVDAVNKVPSAGEQNTVAPAGTNKLVYKNKEATLVRDDSDTSKNVLTTNDTVFFYAFLNKKGAVDSVNVYLGKDKAPSVEDRGTNGIKSIVVMNPTGDNAGKAAAVVITTKSVATTNYMYVIDYLYTDSDGDVYQVYMDGEVQEITTNGANSTRYVGAYTYTLSAKGLYDLKQPDHITAGAVSMVDSTSLVLLGGEYNLTDADVVLIDGKDSDTTTVNKWDTVVVVYDTATSGAAKAKAVYVVEEYADTNTGATLKPNATKIRQSADDDNLYVFDAKAAETAASVLADLAFPYSYKNAYVTTTDPAAWTITEAKAETGKHTGTIADGTDYWIVVISEDNAHFSTYKTKGISTGW